MQRHVYEVYYLAICHIIARRCSPTGAITTAEYYRVYLDDKYGMGSSIES